MKINNQTNAQLKGQEIKGSCFLKQTNKKNISLRISFIRFQHTAIALSLLIFKRVIEEAI